MRKAIYPEPERSDWFRVILLIIISSLIILPFGSIFAYSTNYQFTGQEKDPTGLYNYGQRYYDPNVGRFTQPDPLQNYLTNPEKLKQMTGRELNDILANPQSLNPYSYTVNNPVKYIDPNGEFWQLAIPVAISVFSGVFLDRIQTVQAPTSNSTPAVIESRSIGDFIPGIKDLSKTTRWFAVLGLNLSINKISAGKKIVSEIVEKFGVGSAKSLIKMYHGSANNFIEILKNGFEKGGKLWLTDSAALANSYQYKFGLTDNFGVKTLELSKNLFANLIDQGHIVVKEVMDKGFPFAREYGLDDYARTIINKIIKKG